MLLKFPSSMSITSDLISLTICIASIHSLLFWISLSAFTRKQRYSSLWVGYFGLLNNFKSICVELVHEWINRRVNWAGLDRYRTIIYLYTIYAYKQWLFDVNRSSSLYPGTTQLSQRKRVQSDLFAHAWNLCIQLLNVRDISGLS